MAQTPSVIDAPRAKYRAFSVMAACLFGLWLLLTLVGLTYVVHESAETVEEEARREADRIADELHEQLLQQETVLNAYATFLAVLPVDNLAAATRFAAAMHDSYPHVYMLEIARRVNRADRQAFEAAMATNHRPGFAIRSFAYDRGRTWVPVGDKAATYPIVALYPQLPEADNIIGLDLDSAPHLRAALVAAEQSQRAVASTVFNLVEGDSAYVMMQRVPRDQAGSDGRSLLGGHLLALLVVRTAHLAPTTIDPRYRISARIQGMEGPTGSLIERSATASTALEQRLLPRQQITIADLGSAPRVAVTVERQMRWQDVSHAGLVLSLAISVAGLGLLLTYLGGARQALSTDSRQMEAITRLALHDPLTGLANRVLLIDRINQSLLIARRQGHGSAVLAINFDRFQEINAQHGHMAGDQILREAAQRLEESLRAADTAACLGRDDFVAVFAAVNHADEARLLAVKTLAALSRPYLIGSQTVHLRAFVGVSIFPEHGGDPDTLLRRADQAACDARQAGWTDILFASAVAVDARDQAVFTR